MSCRTMLIWSQKKLTSADRPVETCRSKRKGRDAHLPHTHNLLEKEYKISRAAGKNSYTHRGGGESLHCRDTFGFLNYLKENRRIVGILPNEVAANGWHWNYQKKELPNGLQQKRQKRFKKPNIFFCHFTPRITIASQLSRIRNPNNSSSANKRRSESEYHLEVANFLRFLARSSIAALAAICRHRPQKPQRRCLFPVLVIFTNISNQLTLTSFRPLENTPPQSSVMLKKGEWIRLRQAFLLNKINKKYNIRDLSVLAPYSIRPVLGAVAVGLQLTLGSKSGSSSLSSQSCCGLGIIASSRLESSSSSLSLPCPLPLSVFDSLFVCNPQKAWTACALAIGAPLKLSINSVQSTYEATSKTTIPKFYVNAGPSYCILSINQRGF